ncbi:MAG: YhcH/YjgK/YiaL family protein [bacterium]
MVIDTLENSCRYVSLHPHFTAAFDFLKRPGIEALPVGRLDVNGSQLFALTQEYETKPIREGKLEAHKKYIDIQFIVSGEELTGYAPLKNQRASHPFDTERDIGFYEGEAWFTLLRKGMFAIFFPQDAHLPGRCAKEPAPVKKIVMKIAVYP